MKKGYCRKCNQYGWIEEHHPLPISTFGEGETVKLCPNCHTDYHTQLGRKNLENDSVEYHYEKFYRWLFGVGIILILAIVLFMS
jgi:hypothetical protein